MKAERLQEIKDIMSSKSKRWNLDTGDCHSIIYELLDHIEYLENPEHFLMPYEQLFKS